MIITKTVKGCQVIVGEVIAQQDTFGGTVWDAHAFNPANTDQKKFLGTFTKEHGNTAMDVLKAAEKAVKTYKF
jgi:hypothetical protein